jgi:PAS domain S-box-containing protein
MGAIPAVAPRPFDASLLRTAAWLTILVVAYSLTIWIGMQSTVGVGHTSAMWPAAAVALAAALTWGPKVWPAIWSGFFLTTLWIAASPEGVTATALAETGSIALGATLQAGFVATMLKQWLPGGIFVRASTVFRFAGIACVGAALAPTWTSLTLLVSGAIGITEYLRAWPGWWLADVSSMLIFSPLLIMWREMLRVSRRRGWILEALGTACAIVGIAALVFFGWRRIESPQYVLVFVTLPSIVWIAFRFRPPGVALTAAFVTAIALGAMSHGDGPINADVTGSAYMLFQTYSAIVAVTGLSMSAAITGQKRAEKARRAEMARYQDLYDNAPDMMATVDAETGIVTECNSTLLNTLGVARTDIVGRSVFDFYHPDSRASARAAAEQFKTTGSVVGLELRVLRADGKAIDVSVTASAMRDAEGRIVMRRTAWRDITERKIAERSLRESQEIWRTFIEQAPASIAMFDTRMRYLAVSKRFLSDSGFPPDRDLHGQSHYDVFPDMPAHWRDAHRRALAGATVTMEDDPYRTHDGRMQWLRWEVRPWYDISGLAGVVVFTEDVSHSKQARDELLKLNAELEERVRERTLELERLAREMEAQSLTDVLTGLPNRRALDHKLAVEIRLAVRHGLPLSLVMLDVDHFKQFNDSF